MTDLDLGTYMQRTDGWLAVRYGRVRRPKHHSRLLGRRSDAEDLGQPSRVYTLDGSLSSQWSKMRGVPLIVVEKGRKPRESTWKWDGFKYGPGVLFKET